MSCRLPRPSRTASTYALVAAHGAPCAAASTTATAAFTAWEEKQGFDERTQGKEMKETQPRPGVLCAADSGTAAPAFTAWAANPKGMFQGAFSINRTPPASASFSVACIVACLPLCCLVTKSRGWLRQYNMGGQGPGKASTITAATLTACAAPEPQCG